MTNEQKSDLINKFVDVCGYNRLDPEVALISYRLKGMTQNAPGDDVSSAFLDSWGSDPQEALQVLEAQEWQHFFDPLDDHMTIPPFPFEGDDSNTTVAS